MIDARPGTRGDGDAMATEEMNYEVLERLGDAELRQYAPVIAGADRRSGVGSSGLATSRSGGWPGYIFGRNRKRPEMAMSGVSSSETIAMTAPVLQEPGNEEIAMTAPVLQEGQAGRSWTVSVRRCPPSTRWTPCPSRSTSRSGSVEQARAADDVAPLRGRLAPARCTSATATTLEDIDRAQAFRRRPGPPSSPATTRRSRHGSAAATRC